MKIKYRDNTLKPNHSLYCIDCAICEYTKAHRTCFGLCHKTNVCGGFYEANCEVLEL